ncbi:hypothetical protein F5148DRAFT_570825 [Russula earlei]|uniref:Uncharacterized protein n=1 Tax=Russula earlei TaxID=71964 RepID=A0ACC0UHB9_9AGAM|nr:hypothetical protein F5148DRAFT_570825 [Russula earlei]
MPTILSSLPVTDIQVPSPFPASSPSPAETDNKFEGQIEADPSIIEALKGKERLFVLRVGEDMERIINERKGRVEIPTVTSYQRLLIHRCSAYYKVYPENDASSKSIWISYTLESRIPSKRISELVPLEQTKQPAIKIMSRSVQDRIRAQSQSRTGSVNGEDAESSDVEPSEAGSLGGRSSAPIRPPKKALTLEEREAAYNEARSRIFLDFEKKAKEKENDMSASSSTFSLVSGSASTSGGGSSSAGDIDDSISTAPTESEFSGPVARDNKVERRNGSGANSAGSSRSMLSHHKVPSSTRGSRAPSPSFTYASIYDPVSNTASYDASQAPPMQQPYTHQFMYPYSPPFQEQGPGQGYIPPPLPYYPYGYPQPPPLPPPLPPQHHASNSDPTRSTVDSQTPGLFAPPPQYSQQLMYMGSYSWTPNPTPAAPSTSNSASLPHSHPLQYSFPPAAAPQYSGYNVPTYFPPMGPMHPPAHGPQPLSPPTHPIGMLPLPQGNDLGIRVMPPVTMDHGQVDLRGRKRGNSRNGGGSLGHGPGFGGYPFGLSGGTGTISPVDNSASPVGPRLNISMRRTSGTSNGSRTPGDEASSVTSSTSSSSRTTSSQHPLPPRPDWAVGLKPNPTLHPRQSARNGGPRNHTTSAPAVSLQPADFPPLGGARAPPVPTGVWTSGAGKAREPGGGVHRDGGGNTGVVGGMGMESTPSRGSGLTSGPRLPRIMSAPPATAPPPREDVSLQDLRDGMIELVLDKDQS